MPTRQIINPDAITWQEWWWWPTNRAGYIYHGQAPGPSLAANWSALLDSSPGGGNPGLGMGSGSGGLTLTWAMRNGRLCRSMAKASGTGFGWDLIYLPWWVPAWQASVNGAGSQLVPTVLVFDYFFLLTGALDTWDPTQNDMGLWFVPPYVDPSVPTVFGTSNLPNGATPFGGFGLWFDNTGGVMTPKYKSYDQGNVLDEIDAPAGSYADLTDWCQARFQVVSGGQSRDLAELTIWLNGVKWVDAQPFDGVKLMNPMQYTLKPNTNPAFAIGSYFEGGASHYINKYDAVEVRSGRADVFGAPMQSE